jgi:hypothetical protein
MGLASGYHYIRPPSTRGHPPFSAVPYWWPHYPSVYIVRLSTLLVKAPVGGWPPCLSILYQRPSLINSYYLVAAGRLIRLSFPWRLSIARGYPLYSPFLLYTLITTQRLYTLLVCLFKYITLLYSSILYFSLSAISSIATCQAL